MGQRLGVAAAMLGNPQVLLLDEPGNGLDPEGIRWVRTFMRQVASEGRTVFVSSHLMSEMSVTADRLIVIGRGQLIADCSTGEFIQQSSERSVLVRTPDRDHLRELIKSEGGSVADDDGPDETGGEDAVPAFVVTGLPAPRVGEIAASARIVLHELTPRLPSLEEAFMELTAGAVEYGGRAGAPADRSIS
jgi:ABC-2 type transport system ATP-binding protein